MNVRILIAGHGEAAAPGNARQGGCEHHDRAPDHQEHAESEAITGTQGSWSSGNYAITGERPWSFPRRQDNQPYDAEHVALFESIRGRRNRINDLRTVAESTLTAIMGRMACYTGQAVTWEQALNSQQAIVPANLTWDTRIPMPAVAVPGRTELT